MSRSELPAIGNLAWLPLPDAEEIELLDRFNGVPTLGVLRGPNITPHLFWRMIGYVTPISFWVYIPLTHQDLQRLEDCEAADLLTGTAHNAPADRPATVAIALDNRLIFEREWVLPARLGRTELMNAYLDFVGESLQIMLTLDLPPSRREKVEKAQRTLRELVDA